MIDYSALQKYSLFGGVLPEEIEKIKPLLGTASFGADQVILREGEPNGYIHFILEGRVKVTKRGTVLVELGEGDTFGEMEFLDVMPSAATVRALVPTTVITLSSHTLHGIFRMSAQTFALIVMNLARDLSRRLRRMDDLMTGSVL